MKSFLRKKKTVYICGRITGRKFYRIHFLIAEIKLRLKGFNVINPARLRYVLGLRFNHSQYMSICLPLLHLSDYIKPIDKEISEGMDIELSDAAIRHIPIIGELNE